jgi:hypothetical protein
MRCMDGGTVPVSAGERVAVVIGTDPELATALRDRLDRAYLTVIEARAGEEIDVIAACRPWPWMVVGAGAAIAPGVVSELARNPILVVWWGAPPPALPGHAVIAGRFAEVVAAIRAALTAQVSGMRLAIGGGVDLPMGGHVANAALEALVAGHPGARGASTRAARSATRALAAHGLALEHLG